MKRSSPPRRRKALAKLGVTVVPVVNTTSGRGRGTLQGVVLGAPRSPAGRTGRKAAPVPPITPKVVVTPEGALWFVLPEPPSANRYWKVWRGRAVLSPEARAYKAMVRNVGHRIDPYVETVEMIVHWHRGAKRGDLSNRIKIVEDALNGVAYGDDKQIARISAHRFESPGQARIEVVVSPMARF